MNIERIEALVVKHCNDLFNPDVTGAQVIRNALTEQAETHARELRAYEATVANLDHLLETERMRLVACGVIALANTPESAAQAREMLPEYWSASAKDCADMVDREMALRERIRQLEAERVPVFLFNEGMIACAFLTIDSGYGITLHKSAVAGVAGEDVPDEKIDKLSPPLSVLIFKSESHARDVYKALISAPQLKEGE